MLPHKGNNAPIASAGSNHLAVRASEPMATSVGSNVALQAARVQAGTAHEALVRLFSKAHFAF
jgi:hypothetical protein